MLLIMERVSFTLEFLFRASPTILYKFFTAPDAIIRWFCDEADAENDVYTFVWDGAEEVAELVDDIEEERIRFKWEDADDEDEFLEIRWRRSEVTGETIMEIQAFCDDDEVESEKGWWENQIKKLRVASGG